MDCSKVSFGDNQILNKIEQHTFEETVEMLNVV